MHGHVAPVALALTLTLSLTLALTLTPPPQLCYALCYIGDKLTWRAENGVAGALRTDSGPHDGRIGELWTTSDDPRDEAFYSTVSYPILTLSSGSYTYYYKTK